MKALAITSATAPDSVLAWLTSDNGRTKWAPCAPIDSKLRSLIAAAATGRPRRIFRETGTGPGVVIRERMIGLDDPAWWGAWADAVTYCPAARDRYMARIAVAGECRPSAAFRDVAPAWQFENAFAIRTQKRPQVVCPCGASYPFLAARCPVCGGADPLGAVIPGGFPGLPDVMARRLRSSFECSALVADAKVLRDVVETHKTVLQGTPPEPLDSDSDNVAAQKTIDDLKRRVRIGGLTKELLAQFKQHALDSSGQILNSAREESLAVRRMWSPDVTTGWCPTSNAAAYVKVQLSTLWKPAFVAIKETTDSQVAVIGRFVPIHTTLKKAAQASVAGKILRWGVTVFSAVKTLGISLVVKGALWAFKDAKNKRALERFDTALAGLMAALECTSASLGEALKAERAAAQRRRQAFVVFLCNALALDYCNSSASGQVEIAARLASVLGKRPPRGDKRRSHKVELASVAGRNLPLIIMVVASIAALIGLVAFLFLR